MKKHPLDILAESWKTKEDEYFTDQASSDDFFELNLTLTKTKTGSQIKDWHSPKSIENQKQMEKWDWTNPFPIDLTAEPEIKKYDKLLSSNDTPADLPDFGFFELFKSAKLTDFISGSFLQQYGLIINEKIKETITQFNIGTSKFFPVTIELKDQKYSNYYFLKTTAADNYVDFEKSAFYEQDGLLRFETRKALQLNSLDEIKSCRQKYTGTNKMIFAKNIVLNSEFPSFDYFTFNSFGIHKKFISTRLADRLKTATGIQISPTNRMFK